MSAGSPFLNYLFLSGSLFPRNSVVDSWTVANPNLCLWVLAYSLDRVSFHTDLLESIDLLLSIVGNLHLFIFPLPLDLPLAAAAPEAGFSSCVSREEKCFSRIVCSRYWSAIFSVWYCSLFLTIS